jgi:hypothetical protein
MVRRTEVSPPEDLPVVMRDDMAAKAQRAIEKSQNQSWRPLLVVSATGLIMVFNVAALNMALGAIVVSLHAPVSSVQLAIVAYSRAAKPVRETIRMKNDRNKGQWTLTEIRRVKNDIASITLTRSENTL